MDLSERPAGAFQRHPWEVARARFFRKLLRSAGSAQARTVLDVGAGDAWFSQQLLGELAPDARITCWDAGYTPDAIATLSARDAGRIAYTRERPRGTFDVVVLLDVLEHVEHDAEFLAELMSENVGAHTTLLMSVPAWQALYGLHDARLRHFRRYAPRDAARVLRSAGLTIVRSGGLFHSLVVPRAVRRTGEMLRSSDAGGDRDEPEILEWRGGRLLSTAVRWALAGDNALSLWSSRIGVDLPGLSWWAICRR